MELKESGNILKDDIPINTETLNFFHERGIFICTKTGDFSKGKPKKTKAKNNQALVKLIFDAYISGNLYPGKFFKVFGFARQNGFMSFLREYAKVNGLEYKSSDEIYGAEIKQTRETTNLKNFGVKCNFSTEETKAKSKATNLKRYGVENSMQNEAVKAKAAKTNRKRYGGKSPQCSHTVRVKSLETIRMKYGVENVMQSPEIAAKQRKTMADEYGVEFPFQNEELMLKAHINARKTCIAKYGVPYAQNTEEVKSKISIGVIKNRETWDERYRALRSLDTSDSAKAIEWITENYGKVQALNLLKTYGLVQPKTSRPETIIRAFLDSLGIQYEANKRPAFMQGLELDIWIPDHNVAIEINGIYWHSSAHKDRFYHQNKKKLALQAKVSLMMFTDEQIFNQFDIVKSIIKHRLKLTETKISARKCKIQEISTKEAQAFLETNHLDGYVPAKLNFGLFHGSELIQVCTFSKSRYDGKSKTDNQELIRMATKVHCCVRGGFDKLIKHFKANYLPEGANLISFVNANYYDGNSYGTIGTCGEEMTSPDLWFVYEGQLMSRQRFMKHNLYKIFPEFPQRGSPGYEEMNANQFLRDREIFEYYGCGNFKAVL